MLNNIKNIFYIGLIICNYCIYSIIIELQEQTKCICNKGWRIENIKMISILTIIISFINLFIPLIRLLYRIPVVSTMLTFGIIFIIFIQLFLLVRLSRQLNTLQCKNICNINWFLHRIQNLSITTIFICSLILSTGLLCL